MKRFIILPLVIVLGVFVSFDGLRAVGPLTSQEDAGEETSRAEAIKANFDKLVSDDKEVKREALLYFGKVDKTFAAEVPLFTSALKDERTQVRAISAYALGKIGIAAVGSIAEVEKLLTDSSATVQRYAKRALERLQPLKPALKKLTAEEAADAMAYWIGRWEFTGEDVTEGKAPLKQTGSVVYTWDKKGQSIKGVGTVRYGNAAAIPDISNEKFDPVSGLFIWRWRQGGNENLIHRRYDPITKIYHDKFVRGETAVEVKEVVSMRITGPDSVRWSVEAFVEGKLNFSSKGEMKRVKKASPRKELAKKPMPGEAQAPMPTPRKLVKKLEGLRWKLKTDKNGVVVGVVTATYLNAENIGNDRVSNIDLTLVHLQELPDLQELSIQHSRITPAGLAHLEGLKKLRKLDLFYSRVTDAGLAYLKGLTNLEDLTLVGRKTTVTDAGLVHLKRMTKLKRLNLSSTRISNAGVAHLRGLTEMETLYLPITRITNSGLGYLKGMRKLKELMLGDPFDGTSQISNAGLKYLKGLTKLEHVFIFNSRVNDSGGMWLKKALPDCKIGVAWKSSGKGPKSWKSD